MTDSKPVAQPRPASTALLLRTTSSGLKVFMVQRHRRSGFLPNAWVFPGGRVDEGDRLHGHPRVSGKLQLTGLSEAGAAAYGVAAVRETFEEAGIWLGEGTLGPDLRAPLASGNVHLGAVLDSHSVSVMLDRVRAWSWWITPVAEPKRFDTRFLVALAPDAIGMHDDKETVDSAWISPRDVLKNHVIKDFPLAPPTWWTLRELAGYDTAEDAFEGAFNPAVPVQPVMQFGDAGMSLLLPGHPDHGAPPIAGLPDRISFDGGWVAWTGDDRMDALP